MPQRSSSIPRVCWAKSNECSGPITKEHVVSASILKHLGPLRVTKASKEYVLGTGSYVTRNLCEYHNGRLSPYDNEALRLVEVVGALAKKKAHPRILSNDRGQLVATIDGSAIERWFAKTFMNAVIFEANAFRTSKPPLDLSTQSIVDQLFNGAQFSRPFGLRTAKRGTRISANYRPGTHTGLTHAKVERHRDGEGWAEFSIPVYYYFCIHGIEFLGFFNATSQADDFTLAHWLKPHAEFVEERTMPLPFKVGFSLSGDKEFGSFGPARIIDLANGAE
jgi:hypothetical protein